MLKIFLNKLKKNYAILGLLILIFFTGLFTTYFNYEKSKNIKKYENLIDNVYLQKL